jgi:protocatechuate 3,4-dioxygenase beta subunit
MRRTAVLAASLVAAGAATALAVDARFVRMWEAAQRERPARLASAARIAPPGEPGQSQVVRGRVLQADGGRPAAGVVVFAYQTDDSGVYAKPGLEGRPWRLKGWARTDAQGRFEFTTIRPAPYPAGGVPAHIHVTLIADCCGRQFYDLMFDDDPLATPAYRARFAQAGEHGLYGAVRSEGGVQRVDFTLRLRPRGDF